MKKLKKGKFKNVSKMAVMTLVAAFLFASCSSDDTIEPVATKTAPVTLQFKTVGAASPTTNSLDGRSVMGGAAEDTLSIQGSNGILKITNIHFIVDEFELEMAEMDDDACEGLEGQAEDDCEDQMDAREEFEMDMAFVQLPIGQGVLEMNTTGIHEGVYDELEFEIDNLDSDEDDTPAEIAAQEAVKQAIEAAGYENWPEDASMVVEGTFAPTNGAEVAFKAYVEAEVEIEMILNPALEITNGAAQAVTVNIYPEKWFVNTDGTVVDLSQYDETNLYQMEWEVEGDGFDVEVDND